LRIASDVVRTAKTQGSPVGTLFSHASGKADAVVIVLGGSEGGIDENRAAIIASNGFDAFAMGYFGMDGLPKELANIPLEDVDQTIQWLDERPDLRGLPIVLEGDSKGAEFALLAAARNPAVCAVVAVSPSSQVFEGFSTEAGVQRSSWTVQGVPVPFANNPVPAAIKAQIKAARAMHVPISYRNQYLAIATPPQDESTIPVWNVRGPLFLVAGADDQLWPSDVFVNRIIDERKSHRVSYHDVALIFPKAGHQIDVPYMPTSGVANVIEPGFSLALGGTPSGYAKADATMWLQMLSFMRRACAVKSRPRGRL
jgi:dienelactone hydrolase